MSKPQEIWKSYDTITRVDVLRSNVATMGELRSLPCTMVVPAVLPRLARHVRQGPVRFQGSRLLLQRPLSLLAYGWRQRSSPGKPDRAGRRDRACLRFLRAQFLFI